MDANLYKVNLYQTDKALEQYPALVLDEETAERVRHGNAFWIGEKPDSLYEQSLARVYDDKGQLQNARLCFVRRLDYKRDCWAV